MRRQTSLCDTLMLTFCRLECSYGHRLKQARGPQYVAHLEQRVEALENEAREARARRTSVGSDEKPLLGVDGGPQTSPGADSAEDESPTSMHSSSSDATSRQNSSDSSRQYRSIHNQPSRTHHPDPNPQFMLDFGLFTYGDEYVPDLSHDLNHDLNAFDPNDYLGDTSTDIHYQHAPTFPTAWPPHVSNWMNRRQQR